MKYRIRNQSPSFLVINNLGKMLEIGKGKEKIIDYDTYKALEQKIRLFNGVEVKEIDDSIEVVEDKKENEQTPVKTTAQDFNNMKRDDLIELCKLYKLPFANKTKKDLVYLLEDYFTDPKVEVEHNPEDEYIK